MTKLQAAYVAGVVDGEGYVTPTSIQVTNCNLDVLHRLKTATRCGYIYRCQRPRSRKHRVAYRWVTRKAETLMLMPKLIPHLTRTFHV